MTLFVTDDIDKQWIRIIVCKQAFLLQTTIDAGQTLATIHTMDNHSLPQSLQSVLISHSNDQQDQHIMTDIPPLEPISPVVNLEASAAPEITAQATDIDMNQEQDEDSMPELESVSNSSDSDSEDSDRDANEVQMQALDDDGDAAWTDEDDLDSDMPGLEPIGSSPRVNNRRQRVEDDGDEERDRRHPSQRIGSANDNETTSLPASTPSQPLPQSQTPTQIQPLPHQPPFVLPHIRATFNIPSIVPIQAGNNQPFRFFQHMMPQNTTTGGVNPPQANPAPPGAPQTPQQMFGGFAITIDLANPTQLSDLANGGQGQAHTHVPGAQPQAFLDPGSFAEVLARLGAIGQAFGFSGEREQDDPGRAKKLVEGLEEVPVGLVRRLERVGGTGGGMGHDESSGGDSGCAICWDKLLDGDGVGFGNPSAASTETEASTDKTNESLPSSSSSTQEEVKLQPKIVTLPCAHVFHASCLIPWFSGPRQTTCPTCRFNIDPENLTYTPRSRRRAADNATSTGPGTDPNATPGGNAPQNGPVNFGPGPTSPTAPLRRAGSEPPLGRSGLSQIPTSIQNGTPLIVPIPVFGALAAGGPISLDQPQAMALPHLPEFGGTLQSNASNQPPAPPSASLPTEPSAASPSETAALPTGSTPEANTAPSTNRGPPPPPQTTARQNVHAEFLTIGFDVIFGGPHPGVPSATRAADAPVEPEDDGMEDDLGAIEELERLLMNRFGGGTNPAPAAPATGGGAVPMAPVAAPSGPTNTEPVATSADETLPRSSPPNPPQPQAGVNPGPSFPQFGPFPGLNHLGNGVHFAAGTGRTMGEAFSRLFGGVLTNAAASTSESPDQPGPRARATSASAAPAGSTPNVEAGATANATTQTPPTANNPWAHLPPGFPAELFNRFADMPGAAASIPGFAVHSDANVPEREKKAWTPPPAPGPTLRQRIERREREAGLRCYDISCGVGPSDEEPFLDVGNLKQLSIQSVVDKEGQVCRHTFHSSCLVSAERVALKGGEAVVGGNGVEVSCPVCRSVGCVSKVDWEEGVVGLA